MYHASWSTTAPRFFAYMTRPNSRSTLLMSIVERVVRGMRFFLDITINVMFGGVLLCALGWVAHGPGSNPRRLAIVGASGGLGRELVAQAMQKGMCVDAIMLSKRPLRAPFRGGGLTDRSTDDDLLPPSRYVSYDVVEYLKSGPTCSDLVLALGGKPFARDVGADVARAILESRVASLERIVLVSARGVNEETNDPGIAAMRAVYLRGAYVAKADQELLLAKLPDHIERRVYRPSALTYGRVPFWVRGVSRESLAQEILQFMC